MNVLFPPAVLDVSPEALLSRHRRFIDASGAVGEVRFSLLIPLEGGSTLGIRIPFSYNFDSSESVEAITS